MELIIRMGGLVSQVSALVAACAAAGEPEAWRAVLSPEEWRAVLSNAVDGLLDMSAALRAQEVPVGAFARARMAGEEAGYERGREDGRREGYAGRRARLRHLALAAS